MARRKQKRGISRRRGRFNGPSRDSPRPQQIAQLDSAALARVSDVDPVDEGLMLYLVRGRPELGDAKGQYQVFYSKIGDGIALASRFGTRRAGDIARTWRRCRRYRASGKLREQKLYVCAAEVECAGLVYAKELAEGAEEEPLALKATPRGRRWPTGAS